MPSLGGLLSRLSQRTAPAAPVSNGACPDCNRAVVVSGAEFRHFGPLGPMGAPRTDDELRLACPVHGRPPHNERSKLLGTASE